MTVAGYLRSGFPRCTVVDKDFCVGANTGEVVPRRRKPHVLYEFCVRSDGLKNQLVRARSRKLRVVVRTH